MPIQIQLGSSPAPIDPAIEREKKRKARFWTGAALIISFLAFVMVLRLYAFEATLIISGSMERTLYKGDYALFDHRAVLRNHWNRGDVIVFEAPPSWSHGGDESEDDFDSFEGQTLVKRIIGMPGESIYVLGGVVYINGKVLSHQEYIKEAPNMEVTIPLRLEPGQYYVMGDNRNNSDDSRNNGPISEGDIRGRVLYKLWPLSRFGALPEVNYENFTTNN